jgi:hypothetical protein
MEMDKRLANPVRASLPNREAIDFFSWPNIVARMARSTGLRTTQMACESPAAL